LPACSPIFAPAISLSGGGEGRDLAEQFALPDDVDEQLERYGPHVSKWAAELEDGGWPLSLDHVDLHPDNAMLRPDGRVLLLDWEEANLSVPFFSLDRLLDDAWERGGDAGAAMLRGAYLDALPWGTRPARERALTLALRLAPLKHAYEGMRLADALGWEEGMPHVTAWAVARMLARWDSIIG
jgi:aminoglycoside phosphotransferase (APT) family kinase protein